MAGYTNLTDITQIETTNTFDDWRVLTNQTIARVNNASASNTDGHAGYDEITNRIVVRDNTASFSTNNVTANNLTANQSNYFFANGETLHGNTVITNSGFYVNADPVTDPSGLRSVVMRTTDAFLMPVGNTQEEPINGEMGMMRFNSDTLQLMYYNPSTASFLGIGGAQMADRDQDTIVNVEGAPGTDEDTINFYVGNTGDTFPVMTLNAVLSNTSINATFRDHVRFEKDITITGNLTVLGQQLSIDATTLAIEDKLINLGMNFGLRNGVDIVQNGANPKFIMPVDAASGIQIPHSLQLDQLVWVTNINDVHNLTEGIYKVESIDGLYEFTLENVDGSAVGVIVGSSSPQASWAGPQTDSAVSGGGFVLPGNTEHSLKWDDTNQYFTMTDGLYIANTNALVLPNGNTSQRPSQSLATGNTETDAAGDYLGSIRFNNELNTFEGLIEGPGGTGFKTWVDFRGMIDNDNGADTFINVYGSNTVPTALTSSAGHTLDDIVFVASGTERFFIDKLGYAKFSSNSGLIIPRGTTAEQPQFPSTDVGTDAATGEGMELGMIRFNTDENIYEGVIADGTSTDSLRWVPIGHGGYMDTFGGSGNNTFLSVVGSDADGTAIAPSGNHVDISGGTDAHTHDDFIVVTNGTKRLFIDSTGWASFTSNCTLGLPRGTTAQRPTTVGTGLDAGHIRFNTSINSYEGVLLDGTTWAGLGGVVDSADGGDTFLNVYGNPSDPTGIVPAGGHTLNDMIFVTNSVKRMHIDANGYVQIVGNNATVVIPKGTTAERPADANHGKEAGGIRFNTDLNSYEGVLADGVTWAGLGGVVDAADGSDTFISVYGHATNPTAITSDANHTLNDIVFTTDGTHRMTVDRAGNVVISSDGTTFIGDSKLHVIGGTQGLHVTANVKFDDRLTTDNHVEFNSTLNTDGAVTFGSTLGVTGIATFSAHVDMDSSMTVDGTAQMLGTTKIKADNTSAQYRMLRCTNADGTTEWVDFGVFNSAGTRVF